MRSPARLSQISRQKIRLIARSGGAEILATGCLATLDPEETAALPGVRQVIANPIKDHLVADLLQRPLADFDLEPVERHPIPGLRQRTRLFVKVQDGCDNRCTFCITTIARGESRSRSIPEIISEIHAAAGVKEIVLTGVHLGAWRRDFPSHLRLRDLVLAVLAETDIPRLRLSSLEPWDLDPAFFELWENPRLCPHLHLPLQSGSLAALKRMARKTTPRDFATLVESARRSIPDLAITTDLIVGFPGETEAEFQESLDYVSNIRFAGGHVFNYSLRPGTAAARMPGQVSVGLRKERSARMRTVLLETAVRYQRQFIDRVMPVLWESASVLGQQGWEMSGLTGNYLRVRATSSQGLWNQITPVRLAKLGSDGLVGQIYS